MTAKRTFALLASLTVVLAANLANAADDAPAADAPVADAPAAPTAMTTPSMTGPLAANPKPTSFDLGDFGSWYVTGAVTGLGLWQNNHVPGDRQALSDFSNGQVFIQKTAGE